MASIADSGYAAPIRQAELDALLVRGAHLIRCGFDKRPADSTPWAERSWDGNGPGPDLLGVRPGPDFAKIDIDPPRGLSEEETRAAVSKMRAEVVRALGEPAAAQRTPSGGMHLAYWIERGFPAVENKRLACGDLRGDNGYVCLYPPDGGERYEKWLKAMAFFFRPDMQAQRMPRGTFLNRIAALLPDQSAPAPAAAAAPAAGTPPHHGPTDPEGTRNNRLFSRCIAALRNDPDPEPAIAKARARALASGHSERETDKTIASARVMLVKRPNAPKPAGPVLSHLDAARAFHATDDANEFRYVQGIEEWRTIRNGRWERNGSTGLIGVLSPFCQAAKKKEISKAGVVSLVSDRAGGGHIQFARGAEAALRALRTSLPDEWDSDPRWLGVRGGNMLDVRSGAVRPFTHEDLVTRQLRCLPAGGGRALWEHVVAEAIPDPDERAYFHVYMAHALAGQIRREHVCLGLLGPSASGKSLLLEAVVHAFGDYGGNADTELVFDTKNSSTAYRLDGLIDGMSGKRLVRVSDPRAKEVRGWSSVFKAVTGDDTITARDRAKGIWQAPVTWGLVIGMNELPAIPEGSIGRRIVIVQCPRHHSAVDKPGYPKADPTLPAQLRAAAPGILQWLLDAVNQPMPPRPEATQEHVQVSPPQGDFKLFLAEFVRHAPGSSIVKEDLRGAYETWRKAAPSGSHRRSMTANAITRAMSSNGHASGRTKGKRVYLDCRLLA